MIKEQFYLTEKHSISRLKKLTVLDSYEIEHIVGRFKSNHWRFAGMLMGEVSVYFNGLVEIRHHFSKKLLWSSDE